MQLHTERLVALDAAESGLCFGRLDRRDVDGAALHRPDRAARRGRRRGAAAGRLARPGGPAVLHRDPAARPRRPAAPAHPHPRPDGRVASPTRPSTSTIPTSPSGPGLAGESVLLAALNATRTGRMTDIVRTIQAEQDRIIRADARGVLVVQGGPGTGKTAVALHRAAYLLYTHRERLARSGLLIVGPLPDVPALHRRRAALARRDRRRAGRPRRPAARRARRARPSGRRSPRSRAGSPWPTSSPPPSPSGRPSSTARWRSTIDGTTLRFTKADAARVRTRGRGGAHGCTTRPGPRSPAASSTGWPTSTPTRSAANVLGGANLLDQADLAALRREVAAEPAVHRLIDRLWPRLTAERLVARPVRLPRAARRGDPRLERRRPRPAAAAAVGPVDAGRRAAAGGGRRAARRRRLRASGRAARRDEQQRRRGTPRRPSTCCTAPGRTDAETEDEAEELSAGDLLDAEGLAERQEDATPGPRPSAPRPTAPGPTGT